MAEAVSVVPPRIPAPQLPRHIGIQPDGNGRWAQRRGLTRSEGHRAGTGPLLDVITGAVQLGIPYLSLHAFTTENWRRPEEEVSFLLSLLADFLTTNGEDLHEMDVRVRWIGRRAGVPPEVAQRITAVEDLTKANTGTNFQYLLNYGGRAEIVDAARALAAASRSGAVDPDAIDDETFAGFLDAPDVPDIDVFLRTSGEQRISNFDLWRCAYAEFVFLDVLWPDVDRRTLWHAIDAYTSRQRRYGALAEPAEDHEPEQSKLDATQVA